MLALFLATLTAFAAPKASSELVDGDGRHPVSLAFDGLLGSGWGEGAPGAGENQWVELDLGKATDIGSVSIWPGNLKEGAKSYREYSRPKVLQVYLDDKAVGDPQRLADKIQRLDVPVGAKGRKLKIVAIEVYEGIVFTDMFIAEVALDFPSRAALGRLDTWLAGKEATKVQETWGTTVGDAYQKHKSAEFGDDAAFAVLTDAVADGAPWMRDRAKSLAPEGYRAQAIPSDPVAQQAVRKLKDPNGIPSFELAMLRATREEARELQNVVEIFYAYQELIGGGNRNVPYWGQEGWEPGALRGFGEPASLVMDATGTVFVADTGNNRVQIYADNGRPNGQWGPKADITDAWFVNGRKFYVSGAAPGEKPGELFNPLDIERIPGKDEDLFAVLDARGRVQLFGVDGKVRISWTVQTDNAAEPEMGGQGYLLWVPQKERLYAIIQNEAVAYSLQAEELTRWTIKDGTPKSALVDAKGKLMFAIGDDVIGYDPDGFRYGALFGASTLGEGFEDMDMALDEQGKLWVMTDAGMVIKYKRPGKVEFKVEISEMPIPHPRLIVKEGIVHYTSDDKVAMVDVLQKKLDAEQAEEDAAAEKKAAAEGEK